jgi:hypothetical protein
MWKFAVDFVFSIECCSGGGVVVVAVNPLLPLMW